MPARKAADFRFYDMKFEDADRMASSPDSHDIYSLIKVAESLGICF